MSSSYIRQVLQHFPPQTFSISLSKIAGKLQWVQSMTELPQSKLWSKRSSVYPQHHMSVPTLPSWTTTWIYPKHPEHRRFWLSCSFDSILHFHKHNWGSPRPTYGSISPFLQLLLDFLVKGWYETLVLYFGAHLSLVTSDSHWFFSLKNFFDPYSVEKIANALIGVLYQKLIFLKWF